MVGAGVHKLGNQCLASFSNSWLKPKLTIRTSHSRTELSREFVSKYESLMSTDVTSPNCALRVRIHSPLTESQNLTLESLDLHEGKAFSIEHTESDAVQVVH